MNRSRYLPLDGRLAYVEDVGEGPAVLCIHTAGQSGVQWRYTIDALAALGYRVIVPDLPGHGRSEPAEDGLIDDLGRYGDWLLRLVNALEIDRLFVVGCSIGGKIALDLATKSSARFHGVVAMAADSHNIGPSPRAVARTMEDSGSPSRADRTYLGTLACVGRSVSEERRQLIATMHRREDPYVTTSDLVGWARLDLRADLPDVTCPMHVVVGEDDFYLDVSSVERTADMIPGATFELLRGIGHYPMQDMEGFPAVLHDWFSELAPQAIPAVAMQGSSA